jgi:molybdopterin converting factor small subunit
VIVRVRLFAVARELAGRELIELEVPAGAKVKDIRAALQAAVPELAPWMPHVLFAVGTHYAAEEDVVAPSDEIACIPPVSGG